MSVLKITPGPWVVRNRTSVDSYRETADEAAEKGKAMKVADCYSGIPRGKGDEESANAQAISAVPELIEAAQFAVDNIPGDVGSELTEKATDLLERALRKAKGEAE